MSLRKLITLLLILVLVILGLVFWGKQKENLSVPNVSSLKQEISPLMIDEMKKKDYPGSDIVTEQDLGQDSNYHKYIASYKSDGLKIFALLTVPIGQRPTNGWPVIVFNHGYIPPEQYRSDERYVAYVDAFASKGYIVFKPDYRGNGNSEGEPEGAYYSPAYTVDVLNAVSSIKKYEDVDADRIGMWGHSLGGNITLRSVEVRNDIKAAVIWAGVVASYDDMMNNWRRSTVWRPSEREQTVRGRLRQNLIEKYGTPKDNPDFWNKIDLIANLGHVQAPIQLHHGASDDEVPEEFSIKLSEKLKEAGKVSEIYIYEGNDHNISGSFNVATQRSMEFFDRYLK